MNGLDCWCTSSSSGLLYPDCWHRLCVKVLRGWKISRVFLRLYLIGNHFSSFLFKLHAFNIKVTFNFKKNGRSSIFPPSLFSRLKLFWWVWITVSIYTDHFLLVVGCSINSPHPVNSLPVGALIGLVVQWVWNVTCHPFLLVSVMETDTDRFKRTQETVRLVSFSACYGNCLTFVFEP